MIRDASAEDALAIAAIWNHYIRDTLVTFNTALKPEAEVAALIRTRQLAGQAMLVADRGGVIGFATYFQFRGGPGYSACMEHTIMLAPGAGGMGAGRALMQAVIDHARAAGHHTLMAGISGANPGGVAFHKACGFEQVGLLPEVGHKGGLWLDLVVMQKRL